MTRSVNRVTCCEQEHGGGRATTPHLDKDGPSIPGWEHDVKNNQVVMARPREVEPVLALVSNIHHEAMLREALLVKGGGRCE